MVDRERENMVKTYLEEKKPKEAFKTERLRAGFRLDKSPKI